MLIGVAKANVFAYHQITKAKQAWPEGLGVGMLSYSGQSDSWAGQSAYE